MNAPSSDSHAAIAKVVRAEFMSLVYSRAEFYEYNGKIFRAVPRAEIARVIHGLDGVPWGTRPGKGGGQIPLRIKVTRPLVVGVIETLADETADPSFFEGAPVGITCANGRVALAHPLRPSSPDDRATFALPFAFDNRATCPMFLAALGQWFAGDADALDKIQSIREKIGVCLVGKAPELGRVQINVGTGANGKSAYMRIVESLFPPDARRAIAPHEMSHPYYRARIIGAQINICPELPEADVLAAESFKAVVTGDQLECREPHKPPFTARATAGHIFSANVLPRVSDASDGFWRRVIVIKWNNRFDDATADRSLADRIIASERAGITTWALAGACQALARGYYTIPASSVEDSQQWREDSDSVTAWIATWCEPGGPTAIETLWAAYAGYTDSTGQKACSSIELGRRLTTLGYKLERKATSRNRPLHVRAECPRRLMVV